jgi:hypothetical protein
MAIARINGPMLSSNLERQGINLAIDGNLIYADVNNRLVGINTNAPAYPLDIVGNAHLGNLYVLGNTITTDPGLKLNLGSVGNIQITGGSADQILYTDGAGNLGFTDINTIIGMEGFTANNIALGSNTAGVLSSNATTLTTATNVTNAIAELNYILGKLVPPSPPNFPNNTTISVAGTVAGRMCAFTQADNSGWANLSVAGGTSVSVARSSSYTTTSVANTGPGSTGTVIAYLNGQAAGAITLNGSNPNTTTGNLYVYNVQDYHSVVSTVTAGFWTVFSTNATGSGVPAGWNRVAIGDSATGTQTNSAVWYYDASAAGNPVFSNTSIILTTNNSSYSSTVPHFNSSTAFRVRGNVSHLSGDLYYSSDTFVTGSAGGAFATPTSVTYSGASVTTPLTRNLYVASGSAYFETPVGVISGFGSSSSGPTLTAYNPYGSGSSGAVTPAVTVLYKTGTSNQIEETAMSIGTLGSGSGAPYRIVNPDAGTPTDTPAYSATALAFNSQTGTFYATDATVVAGVLKYDTTNYSTGYLPIGPNLSTRGSSAQYYTFKFVRTTLSSFGIQIASSTGIAGIWFAVPGATALETACAPTNGWVDMTVGYAGSGIPGSAAAGGNGVFGGAKGGAVLKNTALLSSTTYTGIFGTGVNSSNTSTNSVYVRIKLTSGQTISSLNIVAGS